MIELFCECGVDLNVIYLDGRSAVHLAVSKQRLNIVKYFIDFTLKILTQDNSLLYNTGVEIKMDRKDNFGRTPLDEARSLGWTEGATCIEKALLEIAELKKRIIITQI